ncbi:MAG: hypothetical protein ACLPV8_25490 [Steroidobacteraceae bacterium]
METKPESSMDKFEDGDIWLHPVVWDKERETYVLDTANSQKLTSHEGADRFPGGVVAAEREYSRLQADRAAGKVDTDTYRKRERELAEVIATRGQK